MFLTEIKDGKGYYLFEYQSAYWATIGGIRTNDRLTALDADNKPIDGLFIGGLNMGSAFCRPYYDIPGTACGLSIASGVTGAKEIIQYLKPSTPAIISLAPARFLPPAGALPPRAEKTSSRPASRSGQSVARHTLRKATSGRPPPRKSPQPRRPQRLRNRGVPAIALFLSVTSCCILRGAARKAHG